MPHDGCRAGGRQESSPSTSHGGRAATTPGPAFRANDDRRLVSRGSTAKNHKGAMTGIRVITSMAVATTVLLLSAAFLWPVPPADDTSAGVGTPRTGQNAALNQPEGDKPPPEEWSPPRPVAANQRARARHDMVQQQIAEPLNAREAVVDEAVLEAMRTVPRHVFVPEKLRNRAYDDTPLPIGHGQTISQPYIVAFMTEVLQIDSDDRVLEIGTGSGYQAAVLGQLTPSVFTVEIIEPLAETAGRVLEEQGYADIECKSGDGYYGWEEHAPFDAIIVTAAAGHVPPPLWEQLAPGGRMVIPVGGRYEVQRLILLEKTQEGERRSRSLMAVTFVPLTRELERDGDG